MEQIYSLIFRLKNWGSEGRRECPPKFYSSLASGSRTTPEPWIRRSCPLTKTQNHRKPSCNINHFRLKGKTMNYVKIGLRGCPYLKRLLTYFGGQRVPWGLAVSSPPCLPSPLHACTPSTGRPGELSYLDFALSEPHPPAHPLLLHRYGWVSGHRNAFESGSPHFP